MPKKYIPTTIIWNGQFFVQGSFAEVPDDLAAALDAKYPTETTGEEAKKAKTPGKAGVKVEDRTEV